MSLTLKRLYLDFLRQRYQTTQCRKVKIMIIDQLVRDAGFHRKHAIRTLNQKAEIKGKRGRKKSYSDGARYHLKRLWFSMEQVNGRRMAAMMPHWLESYQAKGYGPLIKKELLTMSHATIERFLKPYRAEAGRKLRTGTQASHLKYKIPMKPFDRNVAVPGYMEADTVAHCGESLTGEFLWSLTAVDRLLGWTEVRAVWNKLASEIVQAVEDIENSVPFTLKGLSTDNGGEFINRLLISHLGPNKNRKTDIFMTRGRPYKKNDQCYVEQKNYTHVRKLLGYDRLDYPQVKTLVNDLYKNEWSLLQNFFMPQVKLIEKIRVGGKYKRKHSEPKTPYHRALECSQISDEMKKKLIQKYETLNPFQLRETIEAKLKRIWELQRTFEMSKKPQALTPT